MNTLDRLTASVSDRYRIERELGQGGMATVYLAEDLKHSRKVAIKVLHPELSAVIGGDRFLTEIKVTANLQHPHILGLIDSGEADGLLYYVMPFVSGESLRNRLAREKQLPIDDALRLAKEVASALDYAHRQGVVHRDIKPENILLQDGSALVADFGIALAVQQAGGSRMTQTGMSLGTPAYMSPEQAMGERDIGARSDVYALGAMSYEMLAGEPPFTGLNSQAIVAKVLTEQPPLLRLKRPMVSPAVENAVLTALQKLPADRYGSAKDFADALDGKGTGAYAATVATPSTRLPAHPPTRLRTIAAAALIAVTAAAAGWFMHRPPRAPQLRVRVAFPNAERLHAASTRRFAITGDGTRMVYVGPDSLGTQLWVRDMNSLTARPLPGTANAQAPFFSPDGRSVAFFTSAPGDLRIAPVDGGPMIVLVRDSANPYGGDWGADGKIYFVNNGSRISRISASGGPIEVLSVLDSASGETEHDWPQLLPGGKTALVQIWRSSAGDASIGVLDLATGHATSIIKDGIYGRYVPGGHVLYSTLGGSLLAVPFNARKSAITGATATLADGVQVDPQSGAAQFAVTDDGMLLYLLGGGARSDQLVWLDRTGRVTMVDSTWRGNFTGLSLSPDGSRIALSIPSSDGEQIWVKQLPSGPLTRLTFKGSTNARPAWTPDGRRIAFISTRGGGRNAWIQRFDGSAEAESLLANAKLVDEVTFAPDGRSAVFRFGSSSGNRDLYTMQLAPGSEPRLLLTGRFEEFGADVSPDSRWFAYVTNESGRDEVYVRRLDDPGAGKTQLSVDGGEEPTWAHNGREIFFRSPRGEIMVADVTLGTTFTAGSPRTLFSASGMASDAYHRGYSISRDDQRFLMINRTLNDVAEVVLTLDWRADLLSGARGGK